MALACISVGVATPSSASAETIAGGTPMSAKDKDEACLCGIPVRRNRSDAAAAGSRRILRVLTRAWV
jgi:hypothetical protein